jgi:NAD(P)-dependent dehydrogenase (short-subunit alcohol dehydrogenase family)
MSADFEGQVVLVTGGASGIGRATAERFTSLGAIVHILDVDRTAGTRMVGEICREGGSAVLHDADVTDEQVIADVVAQIVEVRGRVDVLLNNAGGSTLSDAPVHELELGEFWRCISLDLGGTVIACKHVLPHMVTARRGSVINVSSIGALVGFPRVSAYSAAKGGVLALTRAMAVDYAPFGIRVNAVAPGVTVTERVVRLTAARGDEAARASRALLGFNNPDDVADAVLFLASEASRRITGVTIPVDGGSTAC